MAAVTAQPTTNGPVRFPGARPFRGDEHEIFFARDREIRQVVEGWQRHRVTLLHSSAGAGKTSLLQSGVLPRLGAASLPVGHPAHAPAVPVAAFPGLAPWTFGLLCSWYPFESPAKVAAVPMSDVIRRQWHAGPSPILAAIDQAEFVFGESDWAHGHRERLTGELAEAMAKISELHLLISVRDEHLGEARKLASALSDDIVEVGLDQLDRDAAREAVRRPLGGTGEVAAESIVHELCTIREPWARRSRATSVVDPAILQIACARLQADQLIDAGLPAEQLAAEIDRALAEHCAQALATVAADHRIRAADLLGWVRTTFAGESSRPPGQGIQDDALAALEDWHLLRRRPTADGMRWELRHPRLIAALHLLGDRLTPPERPDPRSRFQQAERALADGDFELARRHIDGAIRSRGEANLRFLADARCFLGNLAHHQGNAVSAADHYGAAAELYEALQDTAAVGRLLTALGRLRLNTDAAKAVGELRAAADRLPNDPTVQTGLGEALWQAGQIRAALAVLDGVLTRDGDTIEALRSRGEILADLGEAESALRDLSRIDHEARPGTQAAWVLAQAMHPTTLESRDLDLRDDSESGPELLRVARVQQLRGRARDAAELAERAVNATRPPLPPQLQDKAHQLMHHPMKRQETT